MPSAPNLPTAPSVISAPGTRPAETSAAETSATDPPDTSAPGTDPLDTSAADTSALALLDRSRGLLMLILLGVLLQLGSLDLERERLLCPSSPADPEPWALSASLLTVAALMGFQGLESGDACEETLGQVSLTVSLIRLMKLLSPKQESPEETATLAEQVETEAPI